MSLDVDVYILRGNHRSQVIGKALAAGVKAVEGRVRTRFDSEYAGMEGKVAAFYGFQGRMPSIMDAYLRDGRRVVFIDLGYWQRHHGGRHQGYHKVAIDGRHPTPEQMAAGENNSRLRRFGVELRPWRERGDHIIVAGMSAKSAQSYGFGPGEWERKTIARLRELTQRPIIYRPKPSWREAAPIDGAKFQSGTDLSHALRGCHAVVTHHSNVAVDALVAGVPAFCWDGAAVPMSCQDIRRIEDPPMPEGREKWLNALALCQWSVPEMRGGQMWRYLMKAGLI